jgi:hypothetical protein
MNSEMFMDHHLNDHRDTTRRLHKYLKHLPSRWAQLVFTGLVIRKYQLKSWHYYDEIFFSPSRQYSTLK